MAISTSDYYKYAKDLVENAMIAQDAHGTKKLLRPEDVVDGDTVRAGRLLDYDTFESSAGTTNNEKARKLEKLGISTEQQKILGKQGSDALKEYLSKNSGIVADVTGYDTTGRSLLKAPQIAEHMVSTTAAIPTDRYNTKLQDLYRSKMEKLKALGGQDNLIEAYDIQRKYNIDKQAPGFVESVKKLPSALASGTQQVVAGIGDFVLDVVTPGDNTWLNKAKSSEEANKNWGYDDKEVQFAAKEAAHQAKMGNYGEALLTGTAVAPEVIGQSIPSIAAMFVPGTGYVKAAQLAATPIKWLTGASKAAKAAEATKEATMFKKVAEVANKNVGFGLEVGRQSNDQLEEFAKNNNGVVADLQKSAEVVATNVLSLGLDKLVFTDTVKAFGTPTKFVEAMKSALAVAPAATKTAVEKAVGQTAANLIGKTARAAGKTAIAGGEEFAQEYLQTWAEILNEQVGSAKYGNLEDVLSREEAQTEALGGAFLGAGAGGTMHIGAQVIHNSPSAIKGLPGAINTTLDKVADYKESRVVNKASRTQADVSKAEAEDEKIINDIITNDLYNVDTPVDPKSIETLDSIIAKSPDSPIGTTAKQVKLTLEAVADETKPAITKQAVLDMYKEKQRVAEEIRAKAKQADLPEAQNIAKSSILKVDKKGIEELGYSWESLTPDNIDEVAEMAYRAADNKEKAAINKNIAELYKAKGVSEEEANVRAAQANKIAEAKLALAPKTTSADRVADEVMTGAKGAITYYNEALAHQAAGNTELAVANGDKLSKFKMSQAAKLGVVKTTLAKQEEKLRAELAKELVDAGQEPTTSNIMELAGKYKRAAKAEMSTDKNILRMSGKANDTVSVAYGINTDGTPAKLVVDNAIVYENIATNGNTSKTGGKAYGLLNRLSREVEALDTLENALKNKLGLKDVEDEVVVKETSSKKADTAKQEVDKVAVKKGPATEAKTEEAPVVIGTAEVINNNIATRQELADRKMAELNKIKEVIDKLPEGKTKEKARAEYDRIAEKVKECSNGM